MNEIDNYIQLIAAVVDQAQREAAGMVSPKIGKTERQKVVADAADWLEFHEIPQRPQRRGWRKNQVRPAKRERKFYEP